MCYFASYNFPAFVYTFGKDEWSKYKNVFLKLAKFNDPRIKKTLAHSIHELAKILGPEITEEDLLPSLERFLKESMNEVKVGALKNLDIFLVELSPEKRVPFIKCIVDTYSESSNDWRTKLVIA